MVSLENFTTISSAIIFMIAKLFPTCDKINTSILYLILSSTIYKYIYIYHSQNTKLLTFFTKIDHLCIIRLFISYFNTIQLWKSIVIQLFTILDFRFMYLFFGYFMYSLLIEFLQLKCYFLSAMFTISSIIGLYSYFDYTKNGWNKHNSWLWHYANTCIILCVKLNTNNLHL